MAKGHPFTPLRAQPGQGAGPRMALKRWSGQVILGWVLLGEQITAFVDHKTLTHYFEEVDTIIYVR